MQVERVLQDAKEQKIENVSSVMINFMARGEPVLNPSVRSHLPELAERLRTSLQNHIDVGKLKLWRLNVSTMMPKQLRRSLVPHPYVHRFFSLYSSQPAFRGRWMPSAMPIEDALDRIAQLQQPVTLHHAWIAGENDRLADVRHLASRIKARGLTGRFSTVRYNPPDASSQETEWSRLLDCHAIMADAMKPVAGLPSKIVTRAPVEIFSACGQFVPQLRTNSNESKM